jgi:hypothetical protein
MLPAFRVARFRFDLEAVDRFALPIHHGSTLRGGFGYAFKKMVCAQRDWRACTPCTLGNECPYGYIFETTAPADLAVFETLREVPVPFVIEAPYGRRRDYAPGDVLTLDVVLVGRAADYLAYFLLAFQELGRAGLGRARGRFVLQRITAVHPWDGQQAVLFDGVDMRAGASPLAVSDRDVLQYAATLPAGAATLRFLTPTRIKHQGQYVAQPTFPVLVRALLRRVSALAAVHCGSAGQADIHGLLAAAEQVETQHAATHWVDWGRYSTQQKQGMPLGGFTGELSYQGDLEPFRALLALGELVHVGKATAFGHGAYRLRVGSC